MKVKFDRNNKEHEAIVLAAMIAADAFGAGRITAAREQLALNDIETKGTDFERAIFDWHTKIV